MKEKKVYGYLPDERPPFWQLLLYAVQQVIVMFPATVTVALITGFQVSTTIFASGLATICFILITGRKIPLYYGSSFAYLTAISALAKMALSASMMNWISNKKPMESSTNQNLTLKCCGPTDSTRHGLAPGGAGHAFQKRIFQQAARAGSVSLSLVSISTVNLLNTR